MEKRVVLAMVLSFVVLWLWSGFAKPPAPEPGVAGQGTVATGTVGPKPGGNGADGPSGGEEPGNGGDPGNGAAENGGGESGKAGWATYADVEDVTFQGKGVDLLLTAAGGGVRRTDAWGCLYHEQGDSTVEGDPGVASDFIEGAPGLLAVNLSGTGDETDLAKRPWRLSVAEDGSVTAHMERPGLVIEKIVRRPADKDDLFFTEVEVVITTTGEHGLNPIVTLEVVGPWLPAVDHPTGEEDILLAEMGEDPEDYDASDVLEFMEERSDYDMRGNWRWIGARADFYFAGLLPPAKKSFPADTTVAFRIGERTEGPPQAREAAAPVYRIPVTLPETGGTVVQGLRLYTGPNSRTLFEEDRYTELDGAVAERMLSMGPISRLLSWLLTLLAKSGLGYGWAILCLTLIVRGSLFPLSRKSQVSMRLHSVRMAKLKPKMDAIKKKHKDPRKQQQETMKLMREEKVSLLPGGCFLAFLQMPIWISLYEVLQTTFEMRHAGFLWFDDLTAPDRLLAMPWFEGVPLLPEWLNLLPILMMITWGVSAHMQPLPADPAQQQQAKMMRWMPMMFGLMLYNFAAGLSLYMTMSALWSIGEVTLIRKVWLSKLEQPPTPAPAAAAPATSKKR